MVIGSIAFHPLGLAACHRGWIPALKKMMMMMMMITLMMMMLAMIMMAIMLLVMTLVQKRCSMT